MTNTQHIPLDAEHYQLVDLCNTKTDELEKTQAINAELLDGLDDIANIAADIDWQQADPKYYRMMLNAAVNRSRALITKAKGE